VVVPNAGATLSAAGMIADLKQRIANFKVPKRIEFVDDLPRNAMGKVQKKALREKFARE
jgi:malonyl-CoA/methylmalonyl-CoA synthetase